MMDGELNRNPEPPTKRLDPEELDDSVTEDVITLIHSAAHSDGGYPTPCNDWVHSNEVRRHAERCAECRDALQREVPRG